MAIRAGELPADAAMRASADVLALRRAALWALLGAKLLAGWGVRWDIQWHVRIGRDSFWIPPHLMTYAGVTLVVLLSFGVLAWETQRGRAGRGASPPSTIRLLGLTGTRGFHVAAWGVSITVLAAPIDDLWHRLFGLDVTIWSPPHLLGFLGAAVNTVGCLLIAREVYPPGSRLRLVTTIIAGAWLLATLRWTIQESMVVAYLHGGVRFHTYAMLAALILPLALVTTGRLSAHRWAPLLMILVLLPVGLAGDGIARVGFALLEPVSVIEEEVARNPTSPIAVDRVIARKNGGTPGRPADLMPLLALVPAAVMSVVDPRRRPVAAALGYAATVFAVSGWALARSPAFQPLVPGPAEWAVAFGLTLAAGIVGGLAARRLAGAVAAGSP